MIVPSSLSTSARRRSLVLLVPPPLLNLSLHSYLPNITSTALIITFAPLAMQQPFSDIDIASAQPTVGQRRPTWAGTSTRPLR